jgi:uncharacterized Zn-finger protein
MIKFVNSLEEVETEVLEGRIILRCMMKDWPDYRHPSRVVQKTASSVIIERLSADYDAEGSLWVFNERTAGDQQVVSLHDIRVICDSAEEANCVVRKSREGLSRFYNARDAIDLEFRKISEDSGGETSWRSRFCGGPNS